MTQLYTITWHSPHGKHLTSRPCSEAQARFEIEHYARCTPDWTYTIEPSLPDWQAQLDAAQARINELVAVCREVVNVFGIRAGQDSNGGNKFIGMSGDFTMDGIGRFWISYDEKIDYEYPIYETLRHLLDTLPPSE